MEKKSFGLRDIVFTLAGVLASVCMFMNWLPINIDLGVIQLNEVLGKINALTLSRIVYELEEALGMLAAYLPSEFAELKKWSTLLTGCAVVTLILYLVGIVLLVTGRTKYRNVVAVSASIGAIMTSIAFCSLVSAVYKAAGADAVKYSALSFVLESPCLITLLCGMISAMCTETATDILFAFAEKCVCATKGTVLYIAEWVEVIISNIGYLFSDLVGAFAGIMIGRWIVELVGVTLIGVLAGVVIAGMTAGVCMFVVSSVFERKIGRL